MRIPQGLLDRVVAHALDDVPDECCGVIASRDGIAVTVHPLVNVAASPLRFEVAGPEVARVLEEIEDDGRELAAIYHSHTRSPPEPSQTDVNFAAGWPGIEWLIVGTSTGEPVARSFLIDDGETTEVALDVAPAPGGPPRASAQTGTATRSADPSSTDTI